MGIALFDGVTASVHQVGLSQTHTAIQIKRVISLAGRSSDRQRSRVRKLIARADYKTVERVL